MTLAALTAQAPAGLRQLHSELKETLSTVLIDQGVGFEWQYDLFLDQSRGFGLFSISDRVYSARGQFSVDTAPGKGCRVGLSFPLAPA